MINPNLEDIANMVSTERRICESLSQIFKENSLFLIDTNVIRQIHHLYQMNEVLLEEEFGPQTNHKEYLKIYNDYLKKLKDQISLNENVGSTDMVITELEFRIRSIKDKIKWIGDKIKNKTEERIMPKDIKEGYKEKREGMIQMRRIIKEIRSIFSKRGSEGALSFDYWKEIYNKYEKLVNKSLYIFGEADEQCADDSLIAASLILLEKNQMPISIISNDKHIESRLRIINSVVHSLRNADPVLYDLMNNLGIYHYSCTHSLDYGLAGTTVDNSFRFNFRGNNSLRKILKDTRKLKESAPYKNLNTLIN